MVHDKEKTVIEATEIAVTDRKLKMSLGNPEHKRIISEILDLYGYPTSADSCITKQEKIMHVYGMMAVFQGLHRAGELTEKLITSNKNNRIEIFCREYYKKYGYHVIPTDQEATTTEVFDLLKIGTTTKDASKSVRLESSRSEEED